MKNNPAGEEEGVETVTMSAKCPLGVTKEQAFYDQQFSVAL